jgi:hypothetical protein
MPLKIAKQRDSGYGGLIRDSPDDPRAGLNGTDFLDCPEARMGGWMATGIPAGSLSRADRVRKASERLALPTAASLFVLGVGILCARPDHGFVSVIVSDHAGGVLARRMLPVAILVPAVLGWLTLSGQRAALFSEALGLAIAAAVTIFAFAVAQARAARGAAS